MCAPQEAEEKLNAMSKEELAEFCSRYGGGSRSPKQIVGEFVGQPQRERLLCYLLGLKTEEDKRTDAMMGSAESAATSARAAEESVKTARESVQVAEKSLRMAKWCTVAAWVAALVAVGSYVLQSLTPP